MPERAKRHKHYVKALQLTGVTPIFGEFKNKDKFSYNCKTRYKSHEEKETDVNIAVQLFQTAINDRYDTAIIVSGGSDLVPDIRGVKNTFPDKIIKVVIPPGIHADNLKQVSDGPSKIKKKHLRTSQFDDPLRINNLELPCPSEWK